MTERQKGLFGDDQGDGAEGGDGAAAAGGGGAQQGDDAAPVAFEALVEELDKLVGQLEGGDLSLEESLAAFERGMAVSKRAAQILDKAEHRIEQLTGGDPTATAPFDPDR